MPVSVYAGWNLAPRRFAECITMNEIFPDIFVIKERGAFGAFKPEINVYVLAGSDGLIFDAGYGNRGAVRHLVREVHAIEERFRYEGRPFSVRRILPSHAHPDHFSGLRSIREELGLRVLLTGRTAEIIASKASFYRSYDADEAADLLVRRGRAGRVRYALEQAFFHRFYDHLYGLNFVPDPDEIIPENSDLEINGEKWNVFPSPGHASDHISLYNRERGVLFTGDNVLRSITTWLGPPNSDLEAYIASLERMLELPRLDLVLAAHGSPVYDPKKRIRDIIDFRRQRTAQVCGIVAGSGGGVTADGIIQKLYAGEGRFKHEMARGWVALTLRFLESRGMVKRQDEGREIRFFPAEGCTPVAPREGTGDWNADSKARFGAGRRMKRPRGGKK